MIRLLNEAATERWLKDHGVKDCDKVMAGIDFGKPVYLAWLDEGTKLIQYRDRPSLGYPDGAIGGCWFALESHHGPIATLGIGHGPAGRDRFVVTVRRPVLVLESTAASMDAPGKPDYARFVGSGGATQVFIPDGGMSCIG